jgi:hypothetical protein
VLHRHKLAGIGLLLGSTLATPAGAAAPAADLADAVRACYDAPDRAPAALEALREAHPEDDDVAWWLARVRLGEGRPADALALLEGRAGRNIPAYRFAWLRARAAAVTDPVRARAELRVALAATVAPPDPERPEMLALAARLAWDAGDEADAVARVREAGGHTADLDVWTRRGPTTPLRVEVDGRARLVLASGLVVPAHAVALPADTPREGAGPDLVRGDGTPCLAPGTRADVTASRGGWVYAALAAPEGEGIFSVAGCGESPRLLHAGAKLQSPAWLGDSLLWIEDRAVHDDTGAVVWPGVAALRVSAGRDGALVVVWDGAAPRLRWAAGANAPLVPPFAEDPPISRASWLPAPPAAGPPGSPPPPPAHPR